MVAPVLAQMNRAVSLYLHIPFCYDKCDYCDFFSIPHHGIPDSDLIAAERAGIAEHGKKWLELIEPETIPTIYIGGGTPSSIGLKELEKYLALMDRIAKSVSPSPGTKEYTIEANPRDITSPLLKLLAASGVNRISLGVQSLEPGDLAFLGRNSSPELIEKALDLIAASWSGRLSVDCIAGIPGQQISSIRKLIARIADAGADHISIYQLSVEEGTPLSSLVVNGKRSAPGEFEYLTLFKQAASYAEQSGFRRYEISAFARPGGESLHNMRYWKLLSYLGLGSGSVSTILTGEMHNTVAASAESAALRVTIDREGKEAIEEISHRDFFIERLITGFRLVEGVSTKLSEFLPITIARYTGLGLLEIDPAKERILLNEKGLDILDTFLVDCLDELDRTLPEGPCRS
jgi:oxygen-independent coproporphyrinogen III oxidase